VDAITRILNKDEYMTLNEAIEYYTKLARERKSTFTLCPYPSEMCDGTHDCMCVKNGKNKGCLKDASEYAQLAKWLIELKEWRRM
jgi:hypothetical protein